MYICDYKIETYVKHTYLTIIQTEQYSHRLCFYANTSIMSFLSVVYRKRRKEHILIDVQKINNIIISKNVTFEKNSDKFFFVNFTLLQQLENMCCFQK